MSAVPPLKKRIQTAEFTFREIAPKVGISQALKASGYLMLGSTWKSMYPWAPAREALDAGDTQKAIQLASGLLAQPGSDWNSGNLIHEANQILGRAALREGRTADAIGYLHAAAETHGSPQLDSFGPRMILAQELLAQGEREAVIAYLDRVARFWATFSEESAAAFAARDPELPAKARRVMERNREQIETWKTEIRAGKEPRLNRVDWPEEN